LNENQEQTKNKITEITINQKIPQRIGPKCPESQLRILLVRWVPLTAPSPKLHLEINNQAARRKCKQRIKQKAE
jgi:hypothetical protein